MPDFSGKHGLIVGVANKRSIAWAIAQATARRGARLALTYQGRFEDHVNELSKGLGEPALVLPCDVASDSDIEDVIARVDQEFGGLDFLVHGAAFALREELSSPFTDTTREGFRVALDISAYSLIALARGAVPLMEKCGGGSVLTLTYLGSERVFPNYNVMGVAKAALEATVRYLGRRRWSEEHPRQRDFRGTDQDAGGRRHLGVLEYSQRLSRPGAAEAEHRGGRSRRSSGVSPKRCRQGRDRRSADGRFRVPHHRHVGSAARNCHISRTNAVSPARCLRSV